MQSKKTTSRPMTRSRANNKGVPPSALASYQKQLNAIIRSFNCGTIAMQRNELRGANFTLASALKSCVGSLNGLASRCRAFQKLEDEDCSFSVNAFRTIDSGIRVEALSIGMTTASACFVYKDARLVRGYYMESTPRGSRNDGTKTMMSIERLGACFHMMIGLITSNIALLCHMEALGSNADLAIESTATGISVRSTSSPLVDQQQDESAVAPQEGQFLHPDTQSSEYGSSSTEDSRPGPYSNVSNVVESEEVQAPTIYEENVCTETTSSSSFPQSTTPHMSHIPATPQESSQGTGTTANTTDNRLPAMQMSRRRRCMLQAKVMYNYAFKLYMTCHPTHKQQDVSRALGMLSNLAQIYQYLENTDMVRKCCTQIIALLNHEVCGRHVSATDRRMFIEHVELLVGSGECRFALAA